MNLLRLSSQQTKYLAMAAIFAMSAVVALLAPLYASAEAISERSIGLSNATAGADDVTYNVKFKSAQVAGAYVVDFCSDSPVIGDTCTAPTGFDASGATTSSSGATLATAGTSTLTVTQSLTADGSVDVEFEGIKNPTDVGSLYARIVSFDSDTNAANYSATATSETDANIVDWGGVAMSITDDINVTGRVLESMIFCVANATITKDCANASANAPVLKLGEGAGNAKALQANALSTGSLYTQISTNAASGAVVSLKSDALACGGLVRLGAPASCDIAPALNSDIAAGEAKFGVKTTDAAGTSGYGAASGTFQPYPASSYNNSTYAFNYVTGDATGITSVYGDPFLNTDGAPVDNMNMELVFGASVANNTPAGDYSTHLSLIATGKF